MIIKKLVTVAGIMQWKRGIQKTHGAIVLSKSF